MNIHMYSCKENKGHFQIFKISPGRDSTFNFCLIYAILVNLTFLQVHDASKWCIHIPLPLDFNQQ